MKYKYYLDNCDWEQKWLKYYAQYPYNTIVIVGC